MNHLKNLIPALSLPVLSSLSCQAEAMPDQTGRGAVQDAAAHAYLNYLAELFHFNAGSLIWMLIGGTVVAVGIFLRSRRSREAVSPMRKPALQTPAEARAATRGDTSGEKPAGEAAAHAAQYWMNFDEATTVTVEELSRIEEEAEVFLMMGRPDVAIKVLRDYLDAEPDCKAYVWFKLLDIYHVQGEREPFDGLAQEIKTRFNVALPTWDDSLAEAASRHGLEHFPNLLAKITLHWNDPSGLEYLQGLMRDNRQGERKGFHEEAFRDMLLLFDVLEAKMEVSMAPAQRPGD